MNYNFDCRCVSQVLVYILGQWANVGSSIPIYIVPIQIHVDISNHNQIMD